MPKMKGILWKRGDEETTMKMYEAPSIYKEDKWCTNAKSDQAYNPHHLV